ncbi:MAG: response regulator [Methanoculleaceae archaeon]
MYTILVVDDSPMIVDVFVTMLERAGYTPLIAYSGEEALEVLQEHQPDLILLDIMMEPMDGWETLEVIKSDPKTREIPVMMLTAKPLTPEEAREYGIYIEDYILKPTTYNQLYGAIEDVLDRRARIKENVERAEAAGLPEETVEEYRRLSRSVEVNSKLLRILKTTYRVSNKKARVSESIRLAISNMEKGIKIQKQRLDQIRAQIPGVSPERQSAEERSGEEEGDQ